MNSTGEHKEQTLNENGEKYYCPMHCEGDKVYNEPGDCPVCGMHLVPASGEKHEQENSLHSGHTMKMENNDAKYACPMHCEGDKTYNEPGDCPVCGMHLVSA